jgi:hypothetical protein
MVNGPVDFFKKGFIRPASESQKFFQKSDFMGRDHAGLPVMRQIKVARIGAKTAMSANLDPGL